MTEKMPELCGQMDQVAVPQPDPAVSVSLVSDLACGSSME